ncbi:MAG: hypothetical protein GWP06_05415 [Actinobacteria bacterium]|nr:hypothetical protein [Actinomycetota bacterium]
MNRNHLQSRVLHALLLVLATGLFLPATLLAQNCFEDKFQSLENWRIYDLSGKSALQLVEDPSVPPGYGPEVLDIRADHSLLLVKDYILIDGMIRVLWEDMEPEEFDADGVIMARGENPFPDEHLPVPKGKGHYWVEHDSDAGFQIKRVDNRGRETDLALIDGQWRINGKWNKTGWVWQKLELRGSTLKAKFWSAADQEPEEWQIEINDAAYKFGRIGLKLFSGHARIACFRAEQYPLPKDEIRAYLHCEKSVWSSEDHPPISVYLLSSGKGYRLTANFTLLDANRKPVGQSSYQTTLDKAVIKVPESWDIADLLSGEYLARAEIVRDGKVVARETLPLKIISTPQIRDRLAQLEPGKSTLDSALQAARNAGVDAAPARVTRTVLDNFIPYTYQDLQSGEVERAQRNVDYMASALSRSLVELKEQVEDSTKRLSYPRPSVFNLTIRDGAFYQGNQPVFLSGVMGWDEPVNDIPKMAGYGFNIIEIEIGPMQTLTGPDEKDVTDAYINSFVLKALRSAERHNVRIPILVSPHYFPQWAYKLYPDVKTCGHGFHQFCIENPNARRVLERHLRFLVSKIKDEPALGSYCLANEPEFIERCEYSRQKFIKYLRATHGTIQRLNELWGTDFEDFDRIQIPEEPIRNVAIRYDWYTFHSRQVTDFFAWMKRIIQEEDPKRPTRIEFMMGVLNPAEGKYGIDREALNRLTEIIGCDQGTSYPGRGEYGGNFFIQSFFYDLMKSFQPNKPILNSEFHIIRDNDPIHYPANYIRTAIWEAALHGQNAFTIWLWSRQDREASHRHSLMTRAEATDAAGRTALDLNRLAKYLKEFPRAQADVAIFYSRTSKLLSNVYLQSLQRLYEAVNFLHAPIRFISEDQVAAGKLRSYKLLLVPQADYVRDDAFGAILQYARDGGFVFCIGGNSFRYNPYGKPEKDRLSQLRKAVQQNHPHELQKTKERWKAKVDIGSTEWTDKHAAAKILDTLFDDLGIARPFKVVNRNGQSPWGVEAMTIEVQGKQVLSLVNWLKNPVVISVISAKGKIVSARNLVNKEALDMNKLHLEPMVPMLVESEIE